MAIFSLSSLRELTFICRGFLFPFSSYFIEFSLACFLRLPTAFGPNLYCCIIKINKACDSRFGRAGPLNETHEPVNHGCNKVEGHLMNFYDGGESTKSRIKVRESCPRFYGANSKR